MTVEKSRPKRSGDPAGSQEEGEGSAKHPPTKALPNTSPCPRLIEVALPVREVSAEAVRQRSPQRGHLSTLHLWWARRPLAASLAIVFASLVPDPDDPRCPPSFKALVRQRLQSQVPRELQYRMRGRKRLAAIDPYAPYNGVADTVRNRLLMFIAKWSPEALAFETGRSSAEPSPEQLLDDCSLVKWETSYPDNPQGQRIIGLARELVRAAYDGRAPVVLDPFAGGGAIPLEAGRLGCEPIANEYNPVAYLILRASCEYPQRYGAVDRAVPNTDSGILSRQDAANPLVRDLDKWANRILEHARERIGVLYPPGSDGRPIVAYFWARTAPCSNPTCRGEIPLLRSLYLCKKPKKRIGLKMSVDKLRKAATFEVVRGTELRETSGTTLGRGNVRCPFCEQITPVSDVRKAGLDGRLGQRMVAVIIDTAEGKDYRSIEEVDLQAFRRASAIPVDPPSELILPEITAEGVEDDVSNSTGIRVHLYGMRTWGSLFNHRQLVAMETFTSCLHEALDSMRQEVPDEQYRVALGTYLGLWLSRNSMRMSTVGSWHTSEEKVEKPFEGARLSMKVDYPEANPFSDVSGGFANQLDFMTRFIERESPSGSTPARVLLGDGATMDLGDSSVDAVVTDPPYFDEAAYADLSDFFYPWLKRAISDVVPDVLATPQTPKSEEATALKHRHRGSAKAADEHFQSKLAAVFANAKRSTKLTGTFSIIFAHQETDAWTALVRSLFAAGLTIDATWPIEMEMKNRPRAQNSAALQTSIAVICRPRVVATATSYKEIKGEIEEVVGQSVKRFWEYGFRGADLIVACYGPTVGVFGRYERVEKADGTIVEIPELLNLARTAARSAIAGDFRGDNISTIYYVWANLYGAGDQPWDDARLLVQIGGDDEQSLELASGAGIFVVRGAECRLAMLSDRITRRNLGVDRNAPLIDSLHRAMHLWKEERRVDLITHLRDHGLLDDGAVFWKLAQALFEVLPHDLEDWKLVSALLTDHQTLRDEAQRTKPAKRVETRLEAFEEPEVV
jgi:putative DNA methylase